MCGYEFEEEAAESSCDSCAHIGACSLVKCPHCGYELPKEPTIVKFFKKVMSRED
jgi:rubredoxin